ncbi:RNA polymerase sigma factor [Paraglaciecola sp.]|uniref:RNA polymerase sigma factor n=1 Tax=Paraglaciecola sp. TaxID=1920173 RepID=UPI003EF1F343
MIQQPQLEHIFRHEYGPLVASLVRKTGIEHIELVEDAIQWSLSQALLHWTHKAPKQPSAWLYTVALRHLLSHFRNESRRQTLLTNYNDLDDISHNQLDHISLSGELQDSLLRMLFVTCHPDIPVESQLVFTLKSLCGFSTAEIANRLFISSANTHKRYTRAKNSLQQHSLELENLNNADMVVRLPSVQKVLYLLFTEGYFSSHPDFLIRRDLCEEALRLTIMLAKSHLGNTPETNALIALMLFNLARFNAREDSTGFTLLAEQNRHNWDHPQIALGLTYLNNSAVGKQVTRYHLEASIAAEHCMASSFENTKWQRIVHNYQLLLALSPSPFYTLNQAVAIAEWRSPEEGLALLDKAAMPDWFVHSYGWYLVLADLQFRCGQKEDAIQNAKQALASAPSEHIKDMAFKRLSKYTELT